MSKTIIIGLPKSFSFYKNLEKNLTQLGFTVVDISYVDHDFKYPSFFDKFYNFLRKTFLNDKGYKTRLKFKKYASEINSKLNSIEKADYALLIRPDIYPIEVIKKIKKKSNKLVGYQWDGLHRFPAVHATIKYFDRFFVFDENDISSKDKVLLPLTNFYFDYDKDASQNEEIYDVYFVGSFVRKRMQSIIDFTNFLTAHHFVPKIMIYCQPVHLAKEFPNDDVEYIFKHLSYEENISFLKQSKIVVDFLNTAHKGLSFRTFEALYYDKKLITTNSEIKKYDFYKPENIFIWDTTSSTTDELLDFMKKPYSKVNEKLKQKYSFTNWLNYVLDIPPFEEIKLPK
ncbi:hypothetical protein [Epilithonimonas xixisoli]|uniref:Lipopolysaccharide biosynthesis protein n=1 Tax=Epilithonimonas xixisoli TaxID=1476462 RepID=A0A4R8I7S1_9FLAO|nr:hypothetical protein [Epilithonimonas xixisoli]TDX82632.1 hypothetical protein B0I22_2646 [Epilithonimonas xixisoli]